MLTLVSDENLEDAIVNGLFRREPNLDLVRARDVGLASIPDPNLLAWAAAEGRVVVTHDRNTLVGFAYQRVVAGQPMSGVLVVSNLLTIGQAIDEILLAATCYTPDEMKDRVEFLPL